MSLILLADDDDILVDLVRFHLEADGHELITAGDGVGALELAKERIPDLVILDAMMPMLSGREVLSAMREYEATRSIPVMMLTARKNEDEVVDALKAGAGEYVTKPFRPQELSARVASLLRQSEGRRGAG